MKLKLIAPLLVSLLAAPAFAHLVHDADEQMPVQQEAMKDAKAMAPKAKHKPAPKQDKATSETPVAPAATDLKKTP
ncbi:MAG: hypothetical protein ACSLE5_03940 [Porticoccaceae bacterium]